VSEGRVVIAPVHCVSFDLTELAQLATYVRNVNKKQIQKLYSFED